MLRSPSPHHLLPSPSPYNLCFQLPLAGEAAEALEQRSAAEAAQRVMRLLRSIFEPQGVEVPAPLQASRLMLGCGRHGVVRKGLPGSAWACLTLRTRLALCPARPALCLTLPACFPLPGVQVMTTQWGADPFARGSYSSMSVGTHGGSDYDCLAESLGGRVSGRWWLAQ